jgi:hypothetical protein
MSFAFTKMVFMVIGFFILPSIIWWQDLKLAKGLKEKKMEWTDFKKYFEKQCLA